MIDTHLYIRISNTFGHGCWYCFSISYRGILIAVFIHGGNGEVKRRAQLKFIHLVIVAINSTDLVNGFKVAYIRYFRLADIHCVVAKITCLALIPPQVYSSVIGVNCT